MLHVTHGRQHDERRTGPQTPRQAPRRRLAARADLGSRHPRPPVSPTNVSGKPASSVTPRPGPKPRPGSHSRARLVGLNETWRPRHGRPQGDQGKPRPALIVQADMFSSLIDVTILPITGTLLNTPLVRVEVAPTPRNGLTKPSHIMIDKAQTAPRTKFGGIIGHLEDVHMLAVNRAPAVFLGLA